MTIHWCGTGLSAVPGLRRLIEAGHDVVVWNRTLDKARDAVGDLTDKIHVFDIDALGEKLLFLIDVEPQLMIDSRGGMLTYNVIKQEVIKLVQGLPSGILFNAILFHDEGMHAWKPSLQSATAGNKQDFTEWLTPVNATKAEVGLPEGGSNFKPNLWADEFPQRLFTRSRGGNAKTLVALGALEMKPDVIYFFSNYLPSPESLVEIPDEWSDRKGDAFLDRAKELGYASVAEWRKAYQAYRSKVGGAVASNSPTGLQ